MHITTTFTPSVETLLKQFIARYKAGDYESALDLIQQILLQKPNSAAMLSNAASTAHRLNQYTLAIDYATRSLQLDPHYINSLDVLSLVYYRENQLDKMREYGRRALQERDKLITATSPLPTLAETPSRPHGKKIISFSLFGDSPKYLLGAIANAEIAPTLYPDWQCRFYVDGSVPLPIQQRLRDLGAEVCEITGEAAKWIGTVWRFLAADDDDVARVIFRDVDSIMSWREVAAVREWEASGKRFHTIRDGGSHTELILAGLWGAVGGVLPNMLAALRDYFRQPVLEPHFADQLFLREKIWLYLRQDVYAHDRHFGFWQPHALPELSDNRHHIGSCQIISHAISVPFSENTPMRWTLSSRIDPVRRADLRLNTLPEMRDIGEFFSTVEKGKVLIHVPLLYWEGISTGDTKVQLHTLPPKTA